MQQPKVNNHRAQQLHTWVEEYGDYLYNFALTRLKSEQAADDLVQETFLSALKTGNFFEGQSSPKTWLTSILKNRIIDYFRKHNKEAQRVVQESSFTERDDIFNSYGIWKKLLRPWERDPQSLLEGKRISKEIKTCLDKLQTKNRQVFILRIVDGFSVEETCKILNISTSNVSVLLYRARMLLRECLEKKL